MDVDVKKLVRELGCVAALVFLTAVMAALTYWKLKDAAAMTLFLWIAVAVASVGFVAFFAVGAMKHFEAQQEGPAFERS